MYSKFRREIGYEGWCFLVSWRGGILDVRVTHVNSKTNQGKQTAAIFKEQESETERKYQQRVLDVEMGSFTPVIFGTNGGMCEECKVFMKQ